MQVINQFAAIARKTIGEVNDEPSMTVPNQSLSVRDILERYTTGSMIPNSQQRFHYDGMEDFDYEDETLRPDFDLSDVSRIGQDVAERLAEAEAEAIKKKVNTPIKEGAGSQQAQRSGASEDQNPT